GRVRRASVVSADDLAEGFDPEGVGAALVAQERSPAAGARGNPVLGAAPGDGTGAADQEQPGPGAEGVEERRLGIRGDTADRRNAAFLERAFERAAFRFAAGTGQCATENRCGRLRAGGADRRLGEGGE